MLEMFGWCDSSHFSIRVLSSRAMRSEGKMRTNHQSTANATTRQGQHVVARTIAATLRDFDAILMAFKRGLMLCARPWYALVPAAPVVVPVVAEQQCSQHRGTRRPDRRSCSTWWSGLVSTS